MFTRIRFTLVALAPLLVAGAVAGGCKPPAPSAPPPQPVPEVAVVVVTPQAVPLSTELPGRTSAYLEAEVRPQVSGIIQKRLFTEGGLVRAGEPLFQIDPSLYQAAVNQASANLTAAQATAEAATARANRLQLR